MNTIVQLTNSEYNSLVEKANLNEKEINERAELLYKEKGLAGIRVNLKVDSESSKELTINSDAFLLFCPPFSINYKNKRKIADFMSKYIFDYIKRRFSHRLFLTSEYQLKKAKHNLIKNTCITIMITAVCVVLSAVVLLH